MTLTSRFIQRNVIGYRMKDTFFILSSDSVDFVLDCEYILLWGLIKFKKSYIVAVPDMHIREYRAHWDNLIARSQA